MKTLATTAALTALAGASSAQITYWGAVKAELWEQTPLVPAPTQPIEWEVELFVEMAPGDATSVQLTGGNLNAPIDFQLDGDEWILDAAFPSLAALDAAYPGHETYTIVVSGGALGSLSQPFSFGANQFPGPPLLPQPTVGQLTTLDPAVPFQVTWSAPTGLDASGGVTWFEVSSPTYEDVLDESWSGANLGFTLQPCTLAHQEFYWAIAEYANSTPVSGLGGFGVDGDVWHTAGTDFTIVTEFGSQSTEVQRAGIPANPMAFQPGATSGPVLGATWDPWVDHAFFAPTAVLDVVAVDLGGPLNFPLPQGTLLLNMPPASQLFLAPAGSAVSIPVPEFCWLEGTSAVAQAASITPGAGFLLTNAIDITFGTY